MQISCAEAAAYIRFARSTDQDADACQLWTAFTKQQKDAWLCESEPARYIEACAEEREAVVWTGWPCLCQCDANYVPLWMPFCFLDVLTEEDCTRVQNVMAGCSEDVIFQFDLELQEDLVRHVLDIYEYRPLAAWGEMLDIGQVMHGMAHMCKKNMGMGWVQKVLLLSWTTVERSQLNTLFAEASVGLVLLHDDNHWALLALLPEKGVAYYYNDQDRKIIKKGASRVSEFLTSHRQTPCIPQKADVPKQPNSWCCGQRVILMTEYIIQFAKTNDYEDLPDRIPQVVFDMSRFEALSNIKAQCGPQIRAPPCPDSGDETDHTVQYDGTEAESAEACNVAGLARAAHLW